jgi:hypothetical protein
MDGWAAGWVRGCSPVQQRATVRAWRPLPAACSPWPRRTLTSFARPPPTHAHTQALEDLIAAQKAREGALALAAEAKANYDSQTEEVGRAGGWWGGEGGGLGAVPHAAAFWACRCVATDEGSFEQPRRSPPPSTRGAARPPSAQVAMLKQRLGELSKALDGETEARRLATSELEARWVCARA